MFIYQNNNNLILVAVNGVNKIEFNKVNVGFKWTIVFELGNLFFYERLAMGTVKRFWNNGFSWFNTLYIYRRKLKKKQKTLLRPS